MTDGRADRSGVLVTEILAGPIVLATANRFLAPGFCNDAYAHQKDVLAVVAPSIPDDAKTLLRYAYDRIRSLALPEGEKLTFAARAKR